MNKKDNESRAYLSAGLFVLSRKGLAMQIEYKKIDELIPYINNPRNNDEAVDAVANSIKEFGFKNPIIVDKGLEIIAGHTRFKASKKLGLDKVPVIVADDLTEEQIKALRLADNKVAELATWDDDLLNAELEGLSLDMEQFGFEFDAEFEPIDDEELVEETRQEIKFKAGKIVSVMTPDEYESLNKAFNEYVDQYDSSFGFVRWLLDENR